MVDLGARLMWNLPPCAAGGDAGWLRAITVPRHDVRFEVTRALTGLTLVGDARVGRFLSCLLVFMLGSQTPALLLAACRITGALRRPGSFRIRLVGVFSRETTAGGTGAARKGGTPEERRSLELPATRGRLPPWNADRRGLARLRSRRLGDGQDHQSLAERPVAGPEQEGGLADPVRLLRPRIPNDSAGVPAADAHRGVADQQPAPVLDGDDD